MTSSGNGLAYLCIALAMAISGSAVVVTKLMTTSLPVFLATELGIGISLFLLLPLAALRDRDATPCDLRTHGVLLAQALCGVALYRICIFWGLRWTSAADGGLITSAAPAMVALLAWALLREILPLRRVAGVVCVMAGLLAVNLPACFAQETGGATTLKGNALILAAVVCEALFAVLSKVRCRPLSPLRRTTLITLYAGICLLPFALCDMPTYDFGRMRAEDAACLLYYGVFVSFLSYILWFKGIERLPAGNAAVFTGVVPISSVFLSALILREPVLPTHVVGLTCLLVGIYLSCRPANGREAGSAQSSDANMVS